MKRGRPSVKKPQVKEEEVKTYNTKTRSNAKYIRLTEALELLNEGLKESQKISRETLLARIRRYEQETNDMILQQDPTPSPSKTPLLVDFDKLKTSIPSLQESEIIADLITKVETQQEQIRILYEVCYQKGFLRRNNL